MTFTLPRLRWRPVPGGTILEVAYRRDARDFYVRFNDNALVCYSDISAYRARQFWREVSTGGAPEVFILRYMTLAQPDQPMIYGDKPL